MSGAEFVFGLIGASSIIGVALWRLATKIENLSGQLSSDQRMCMERHDKLNADRESRSEWICKVEGKIDKHVEAHSKGEC